MKKAMCSQLPSFHGYLQRQFFNIFTRECYLFENKKIYNITFYSLILVEYRTFISLPILFVILTCDIWILQCSFL